MAPVMYTVVSQVPSTTVDPQGNIVPGMLVTFAIGEGPEQGSIFVAGALPDPEQTRARIREYVERHAAVAALTD